jgi:cobalt-zinc-cadmium efflux system membrane fusion protein
MKNIFIIPLVLLFIGCGSKETKVESTESAPIIESMKVSLTSAQFNNAGIVLGQPEKREISEILKLNGKIDVPPQNLVSVSIPMGGYLKTTDLLPGMLVKKGQIIATLEDQQYVQLQQDYLLVKVKLKTVEAEYIRQKELNASKASSDKVFQQAEAEFKNARINLRSLDQNLQIIGINPDRLDESKISKRISIISPIDGYVAKVNANIGKYLTPSEVLFELVNVADIHLNLTVYEQDLPKLQIGQKLVAFNNNQPEKKYPCDILLIGHSLTAEKNTEVHCHFQKYDKSLVPGMYMNAEIELKNVNAITVPEESVVRFGNFEYVFVELKKNHFEMIEIKTGAKENGYVEIIDSEKLNNQPIVLKGDYTILMKLKNSEEE